jgi:glycosyltransferase involved in cell wall biosynthesis
LEHGSYGPLVPVGDDIAMAEAIQTVLDAPPSQERLRGRAAEFSMDRAMEQYLEVLFKLSRKNHAPASTAAAST